MIVNHSFKEGVDMASLILCEHGDFRGRRKEIFHDEQSLGDFDRITSSIIINAGHWRFFTGTNFQGRAMGIGSPPSLGPGTYHWVEDVGITNDSIQSVRLIQS